jgi:hypothetical protein
LYVPIYGWELKIGQTFTEWQLAEFLLDNDPHYRNLYLGSKLNRSERIEDVLKTAKRHVAKLIEVRLLEKKGTQKQTKGTGEISIYSLTQRGREVLLTMQILELEDEIAEKKLFSFIRDRIDIFNNNLSFIKFISIFTKKAYEKGLFKEYVSMLRQIARSKDTKDISTYASLISDITSLRFHHSSVLGTKYLELWIETLNEMPPIERNLYLYDVKLLFDTKMGKMAITREYEDARFRFREEVETIALEGSCNNCHIGKTAIVVFHMKIMDYMLQLVNLKDNNIPMTCPNCKSSGNTLIVPNLWD